MRCVHAESAIVSGPNPARRQAPADLPISPERDAAITAAVEGLAEPALAAGSKLPCSTSPNRSASDLWVDGPSVQRPSD
jgi:hypothetical protein